MSSTIPKRSPYGLIQEDLYPDEWKILVSCIMLNCTSRRQVEPILVQFFELASSPHEFLHAEENEVKAIIRSLGFVNRRYNNIKKMSERYIQRDSWTHANQLPGIGTYGSRAWEIFCNNVLGSAPPNDGTLRKYWEWAVKV